MGVYLKGVEVALRGLPTTLYVSLFAVAGGVVIGLLLAVMKLGKSKPAKIVSDVYIEVMRATPMLAQALIMAYGLPMILQSNGVDFKWPSLVIPAIIVCAFNSAAYVAEILRSGIQAVDPGQIEAAYSLGMSKGMVNKLVVWPQALRICIPALGNELVTMIKETSVLGFVGVVEVIRSAQLWNAQSFETFPAYVGAAIVYLIVCFPLSKLVGLLEKKMDEDGTNDVKNDRKLFAKAEKSDK
ncbi:MAG: amino acid ABC transporter permease [Clostridia bacterium]|nr:amino acid ABC transporter permease [Clostridia bacterium]